MNLSTKQNNRKLVLDYIRKGSDTAIAEIAGGTGISKPTVQKVLRFYEEQNLVCTAGKGESTEEGGKKPFLYRFNPSYGTILAVHIGPSFVYGAIADMNADLMHTVFRERENEDQMLAFQAVVAILREFLAHDIVNQSPPVSIVIALPGIVNSRQGLSVYSPHYTEWAENYPLEEYIRSSLGTGLPLYIDNVNRFEAMAQHWKGIAGTCKNFVMIDAMPEGVGAGVYVNDRVRQGYQSLAGEVGHMILEPHDGPACICGGRGCFEALVSVRNIRSMIAGESGLTLLFRDADAMDDRSFVTRFFDACAEEEEHCLEILDRLAFWFALGFNNILMINDPELIVIEGIYRDAGERFLEMIRTHMAGMGMPRVEKKTRIEFSSFGLERGVLGASVHASVEFFNNMFQ